MKLATIEDGTRDGRLVVVSTDGQRLAPADGIARTLQDAIDRWSETESRLRALSASVDAGDAAGLKAVADVTFAAPLPRAFQWIDGSAFLHHVRLVRRARGAEMPPSFLTDPLVYQGGSDTMLAGHAPIVHVDEAFGIDFEAEIGVITDDVPYGVTPEEALAHVKLIVVLNDVSLRNLIPAELAKGFGFFNSKPPTAFAPFAVTPDALGDLWRDGRLHVDVNVTWNGEHFGHPNGGVGMQFGFHELIAHICKTRPLGAGTIIGSGTVSNDVDGVGSCCIAERRMIEIIADGAPTTQFMRFGDEVAIDVRDAAGASIFGTIKQTVVKGAQAGFSGTRGDA